MAEAYIRVVPDKDESVVDHFLEQPSEEASIQEIIQEMNTHVEEKRAEMPSYRRSVEFEIPLRAALEKQLLTETKGKPDGQRSDKQNTRTLWGNT